MKAQKSVRLSEAVNHVMGFQEWVLIVLLSILWGGSFFFVGVAVKDFPPFTPLSAILLGVMVLGERLEWNAFVGMGLIFIGLITIDGRLLKRFKRKETAWYYEI